jgi:2',3'-cyclic-nucleotide 2'-phosphodiesterase (5'-nucleotidase family)
MKYVHLLVLFVIAGYVFGQKRELKIVHWNDFHSQNLPLETDSGDVGGLARLKRAVDSLRSVAADRRIGVLALNAGDDFQGTIISSLTRGASQIEAANLLAPDAAVLGNHEFDYGWHNLDSLIRIAARYPIVTANLVLPRGKPIAPPYLIKETGGIRIAIIGLITERLAGMSLPENLRGIRIEKEADALRRLLKQIKTKDKPDIIIALTHIGVDGDKRLAREFPEIDVIVGGHSHTPIHKPGKTRRTIIVQAGSRSQYVGELDLVVDTNSDSVVSYSGKLLQLTSDKVSSDKTAEKLVASFEKKVAAQYDSVIGTLKKDLPSGRHSPLAAWIADMWRMEFGADIGIMNTGGVRKGLRAGNIRKRDLIEVSPFGNELVRIRLRADKFRSGLSYMLRKSAERVDMTGILCEVWTKDKQFSILRMRIGNNRYEPKRMLTIVTNSFVAAQWEEIFGYKLLQKPERLGIVDYDALIRAVRKHGMIDSDLEADPWILK